MSIFRLCFSVASLLAIPGIRIAVADPNASVVHLKPVSDALNVVPVMVNGAGPFEFVLDTGSSSTTIDSELAAQLRLAPTGSATLVTPRKSSLLPTVHADSLQVATEIVRGLDLSVERLGWLKAVYPKAQGILGEDFLRNFDFLLDNRHHCLKLEQGPGSLVQELTGEHVLLTSHASNQAESFQNRLILTVKVPELGPRELTVLLDSAASALMLFPSAYPELPGPHSESGREVMFGGGDRHQVDEHHVTALLVESTVLRNVAVVSTEASQVTDSDGLLPTGIFQSIYISHSGGFAIFNPVRCRRTRTSPGSRAVMRDRTENVSEAAHSLP